MAEILLEEVNPNGNIQAVVECDDHVCYFYLFVAPDTQFGMKSVWLAITRGRRRTSILNACSPDLPHATPLATVVILRAGLHLPQRICGSSGCLKVTVRRFTKETRSSPSFPPGAAPTGSTVTPATTSGTGPSRGNSVAIMFWSNASNEHNPTGGNGTTTNSGRRSSHLRSPSLRKYSAALPSTTRSTGTSGRRRR